jgi:hypothetical protein
MTLEDKYCTAAILRKQTAIQCMNITIGHDGPIVARAVR